MSQQHKPDICNLLGLSKSPPRCAQIGDKTVHSSVLVDVLGVLVGILNALVSELGVADDGTSVCSQFNRRSSLENILELEVAGMD